jgi:hypothetical protein
MKESVMKTMCRFHGPTCENPARCETWKPHKYEGDGNMESIDPARLQVGNVLRMNDKDGRMSAFSSSVVLSIRVVYSEKRKRAEKVGEYHTFDTLGQALDARKEGDWVYVKLARPYLYEHIGGPLMGCETYEVDMPRSLDRYKVVVGSTGEYDRRTASFSTIHQEVREREEMDAEQRPHALIHNHMGREGFPLTCKACEKGVK